jgi:propanol-preferring alcohol dehydrogenase
VEALQLVAWKQPPEFRDVPAPDPGPGQVLVRIGGAGEVAGRAVVIPGL